MPLDLSHVPGPPRKPLVGHTLDIVRDSYGFQKANADGLWAGLPRHARWD